MKPSRPKRKRDAAADALVHAAVNGPARIDRRAVARRVEAKRQRDAESERHEAWREGLGRRLRRQVSTEAAVKSRRTLDRVRERESANAFDAWLHRRHALGEFG